MEELGESSHLFSNNVDGVKGRDHGPTLPSTMNSGRNPETVGNY